MGAQLFCGLSNLAAKCTRIGVGGQIPSHLSKPNRCPNQLHARAELTESGTLDQCSTGKVNIEIRAKGVDSC